MKKNGKKTGFDNVLNIIRIVRNRVFAAVLVLLAALVIIIFVTRITGGTPSLFGFTLYRVSSSSMSPELEVGDVILTQSCETSKIKEGDIITYDGMEGALKGKTVTHRVTKAPFKKGNEMFLRTKGDANPIEDPDVNTKNVRGVMLFKIALLTMIYNFFVTPWGLLIVIALIILAFFNEIVIFIKAILGVGYKEEEESVEEIIERYQRENAAKNTESQDEIQEKK